MSNPVTRGPPPFVGRSATLTIIDDPVISGPPDQLRAASVGYGPFVVSGHVTVQSGGLSSGIAGPPARFSFPSYLSETDVALTKVLEPEIAKCYNAVAYSIDSNACHNMERRIALLGLAPLYVQCLLEEVGGEQDLFDLIHASASQRARAALAALKRGLL